MVVENSLRTGCCPCLRHDVSLLQRTKLRSRVFSHTTSVLGRCCGRFSFPLFDYWATVTIAYVFRGTLGVSTPPIAMVVTWNRCRHTTTSNLPGYTQSNGHFNSLCTVLCLHAVLNSNMLRRRNHSTPVDEYRVNHQSERGLHAGKRFRVSHLSVVYSRLNTVFP